MTCDGCESKLAKRRATASAPFLYTPAGLEVPLVGIQVYSCKVCDVEAPLIPHIESLHRLIAKDLITQDGRLSGAHVRFLRKNAGLPANDFAAMLGVSASHLSRVENGKTDSFGDPSDRLVRAFAAISLCGDSARDVLLSFVKQRRRGDEGVRVARLTRLGEWQLVEAA